MMKPPLKQQLIITSHVIERLAERKDKEVGNPIELIKRLIKEGNWYAKPYLTNDGNREYLICYGAEYLVIRQDKNKGIYVATTYTTQSPPISWWGVLNSGGANQLKHIPNLTIVGDGM